MRWAIIAVVALAAIGSSLQAQETRIGAADFESPPATIDQVSWLVGQWSGEGIDGAAARESWLPPSGGTMVGTFVQERADGGIRFTEHLYLMEEGGTLVLRLKHFNADLTAWEEKDGMLSFRLIAIEDCAAYFHGLTLRCDGQGGLLAAVRMKSDGPNVSELLFRFSATEERASIRCPDAMTTAEMAACLREILERADARMEKYHAAAQSVVEGDKELATHLRATHDLFLSYRNAECSALYGNYMSGSVRPIMYLGCAIEMADQRAHTIWQNWLTFMDSTPPQLPEPRATR